ncbi:heme NO-binding domain-containing protein [Umboniibacter marinipuniceus]|uniref:Heme-NO-binding protein n=1 Tax=Umboniibacter marinipuniceus TaxID=569599 RepID=A0A3M0AIQ9_9GAMM|nr:heme NO-binding domain-containing protein [Umboniibacter marinipuniceus]RMA82598.1 heme-NO-binding protein [Umboniibacter marinipuniceus]
MKGVVFTEFFELVETAFGEDVLDDMIDNADLDSDGVYTAVGKYDHNDMVKLVVALSAETDIPVPDLIETYGKHLFGRFVVMYPGFFEGVSSTYAFLARIDDHIHVEVKKLYPDAELPVFDAKIEGPKMTMIYDSKRPFGYLAKGLLNGCIEHFGESIEITRADISEDMTAATFELEAH